MARAEQVPEYADGGYWYVVGVREPVHYPGGREPDLPEGTSGWCAWYGDGVCVVRTPGLIDRIPATAMQVSDVLDHASVAAKPRGRIGGR